jgi:hypothetical protein
MPLEWPENLFAGMCSNPKLIKVPHNSPVDFGWTYDETTGDFLSPALDA